ncbi:glutamate-5-semialdehyde dehydrogenase [Gallaecimonas kandeliae]|uniref:glutamate-5-semialdehyde dehydrogenase n=1 Tax=Gallaecimonas kandeliae TaxID=3029055 RepID=UPI002647651F|nr:glutamate-5-semialdehyde dehydrogenase [Gallaecimonas kandeliae]WKE67183.1 glutamate-5-semialdehyde dehydrogenase [Gallaecimonas kandeliae]
MARAQDYARAAAKAAKVLAGLDSNQKNAVLADMAKALRASHEPILKANAADMAAGRDKGLDAAMLDRLLLTPERIDAMAGAIDFIADLPDPVGKRRPVEIRPNGLQIEKMRIPLGVVCMIYEARPNVTADAGALCLKSGNAVILRGGREALQSSLAIARVLQEALRAQGLPAEAITVVDDPDRELLLALLKQTEHIDLVIPRGGEGLIRFVTEQSRIPVIQHFKGVCHLYVDEHADLDKALKILVNGKTQRTGVCNALEGLLVHQDVAQAFLPRVAAAFAEKGVKVHADPASLGYFDGALPMAEDDYGQEYLALEIAIRQVPDFDGAISHIDRFGSHHTEVICTEDKGRAEAFQRHVDAAVVMVNASSRFSDGGELGLGAEIGISTSKLHAYGPMGLEALTTEKFLVTGAGQVRP